MATNSTLEIVQYRYYGQGDTHNTPTESDSLNWIGGFDGSNRYNLLSNLGPAIKIGIQTLPGVKFYLNGNTNYMIVDHTGVYELDLSDISTTISELSFDPKSVALIDTVENAGLIVDIMYKKIDGMVTN